jgi:hypothetical protein
MKEFPWARRSREKEEGKEGGREGGREGRRENALVRDSRCSSLCLGWRVDGFRRIEVDASVRGKLGGEGPWEGGREGGRVRRGEGGRAGEEELGSSTMCDAKAMPHTSIAESRGNRGISTRKKT